MQVLRFVGQTVAAVGMFMLIGAMALIGLVLQALPFAFALVIAVCLLRGCT